MDEESEDYCDQHEQEVTEWPPYKYARKSWRNKAASDTVKS